MNFQAKAKGKTGEIWLYDQIGADFWGEGVSAKAFQQSLNSLGRPDVIDLHIHSPGGDVFDGMAIYDLLRNHPAAINVYIDGLCASIASVIAMCSDNRIMAQNGRIMIHNPMGMAFGDSGEMKRTAALLDSVKSDIVRAYAGCTSMKTADIEAAMDAETWFNASEALDHRLVTSIAEPIKMAASFGMLKAFKKVPAALSNAGEGTPLRDMAAAQMKQQAERLRLVFENSTPLSNNAR